MLPNEEINNIIYYFLMIQFKMNLTIVRFAFLMLIIFRKLN